MITWTKIDIGDGEAIWYSDCLEYQIEYRLCFYRSYGALYGDSESNRWDIFDDLESAKQWCEEHKKNHSQTACS